MKFFMGLFKGALIAPAFLPQFGHVVTRILFCNSWKCSLILSSKLTERNQRILKYSLLEAQQGCRLSMFSYL